MHVCAVFGHVYYNTILAAAKLLTLESRSLSWSNWLGYAAEPDVPQSKISHNLERSARPPPLQLNRRANWGEEAREGGQTDPNFGQTLDKIVGASRHPPRH